MDYFGHPSKAYVGTMVAILEIGAFITSLMVGRIGDIIGRRRTIFYGSCVFFIGGALQTLATSMPMMMAGRFVAGFGVGALSTIVPVYQSEISPPHNRGKLACIEFTGNIVGYATSVWVDYGCGFIENDYSWRIPLGLQCIMGALLGLGSLVIVESPRYVKYVPKITRGSSLTFADGFWITTMTKRVWLLLPTCMVAVTFTTPRLEMNTARSR
jgi:MFS family permease